MKTSAQHVICPSEYLKTFLNPNSNAIYIIRQNILKIVNLMLQTKKFFDNHKGPSQTARDSCINTSIYLKQIGSAVIQEGPQYHDFDLNVENGQKYVCFSCGNGQNRSICQECFGQGYVKGQNSLIKLMNDIFNSKLLHPEISANIKQLPSAKSSSNTNSSEFQSSLSLSRLKSNRKRQHEHQKSSAFHSELDPSKEIINSKSSIDKKCRKCSICHSEFEGAEYSCDQCQVYNACQQCYLTKRIIHIHQLKNIQQQNIENGIKHDQKNQASSEFFVNNPQRGQIAQYRSIQESKSQINLSIKSDESVDLLINSIEKINTSQINNKLKTKLIEFHQNQIAQKSNNQVISQLCSGQMQKLIQSQLQRQPLTHQPSALDKQKLKCHTCKNSIENCSWVCETCLTNRFNFRICKDCFDKRVFDHPQSHQIKLDLFSFDSSFEPNQESIICEKLDSQSLQGLDKNLSLSQTQSLEVPSSIKLKAKSHQPQNSKLFSIGVIGHKNIFKSFHQEIHNQNYAEEVLSPIPLPTVYSRLPQKRQQHKNCPESDSQLIDELQIDYDFTKCSSPQKATISHQSKAKLDCNTACLGQFAIKLQPTLKRASSSQERFSNNKQENFFKNSFKNQFQSSKLKSPENSIMIDEDYQFFGNYCDICGINPIKNIKYHCLQCEDYDLCDDCFSNRRIEHWHEHFRKDDGKQIQKKIRRNKQKITSRTLKGINFSLSPSRRSIRSSKISR